MKRSLKQGVALATAMFMLGGTAFAGEKIVMWHIFGNATEPSLANIAKWDKTHPDNPIDQKFIPFGQLSQQLIKGIATGDVPDLITIDNPVVASFASQGALEDLTTLVKDSQVVKKENYFTGSWNTTIWNGQQFAVPGEANTLALYYNADMFREKGLDPDKPPRTWAELKAAAEKLTDPAKNVYGIGFSAIQSEEGTFQWLPFLWEAGADLPTLNSDGGKAALQLWVDLVKGSNMSPGILGWTQQDVLAQFQNRKAAMMINGPWQIPTLKKDNPDLKWQVVTLPKGQQGASILGGENMAIVKGSKNSDAAWDLISWTQTPDNLKAYLTQAGKLPSRQDLAEDPAWTGDPVLKVFIEQLKVAKPRAYGPKYPEISNAIQEMIQAAISGQKPVDAAVADAATKITPLLSG